VPINLSSAHLHRCGSHEDEIVHTSAPGCFIRKLDLLCSDAEGRIVALGRLDLEWHHVRSDVRGDIGDRLLCSLSELGCVGARSIKSHNDRNRDDDGLSQQLDGAGIDG
jgi:hypothetical protein